jgi:hypothetical protein
VKNKTARTCTFAISQLFRPSTIKPFALSTQTEISAVYSMTDMTVRIAPCFTPVICR